MKLNLRPVPVFLAALLCCVFFAGKAGATHLVGGSITYRYVSKVSGYDRYEINVYIYRDCNSNTQFDATIDIGFYEDKGARSLYQTLTLPLRSRKSVNPPSGGSNCSFKPPSCLEEGFYTGYIDLPPTTYGFHMTHVRCCRNNMENLPNEEGQTYYGFIPASSYQNTSPYFTDVPAPYICVNDSINLFYTGSEPDGDSLVYSIEWPYAGGDKDDPIPAVKPYYSTLPLVQYVSGYNYLQPFGKNGLAKIDPVTGLLKMYAVKNGLYAIAVDVKEYRKGALISTTRRDIQIIVTTCPPNPVPVRVAVNGSVQNVYNINAGDRLNFDISYTDPPYAGQAADADILTIEYAGDIFNSSITNPAATLTNLTGKRDVTATFNWQTTCLQGRPQPYVFNLKVKDKGCPPKAVNQSFTIYVKPFKGADLISGPSPACQGGPSSLYSANLSSTTNKLTWNVTGGKVVSTGSNYIEVVWDKVTKGSISVIETGAEGCKGDTIYKNIVINPRPVTPPISGPSVTCIDKITSYTVNGKSNSYYQWFIDGGKQVSGGNTNAIDVQWFQKDSGWIKVVERDINGCNGDTILLKVIIGSPVATRIYGSLSVCPNSSGIDYWVDAQDGSQYFWKIDGGVQSAGGNTSRIKVDWGEKGGGMIYVVELTKDGCKGDTVSLKVLKDYVLFTSPIKGDTSLCEFTKGAPYEVVFSNGSSYAWKITGGSIVSGQGTASIVVDWDAAGLGALSVTETAYDPVNKKPCIGDPVVLGISINPIPTTSEIIGPAEICEKELISYKVKGFPGSTYIWMVDGKKLNTQLDSITYVKQGMKDDEEYATFLVTEISKDSCTGPSRFLRIKIHKLPVTSEIEGPAVVCFPRLNGHTYRVKPSTASSFRWETEGGSIASGAGTHEVVIDWFQAGARILKVTEINEFGCEGETKELPVNVDSLYLEMKVVTTGRQDDSQIELYWSKVNDQFVQGYTRIYRAEAQSENFKLIDSVPTLANSYIDRNVNTARYSYRYRVEAKNSCGTRISTNIHRSILLQHKYENDSTVRVNWNPYEGWDGGVDFYNLFRSFNDDTTLGFFDLTKDTSLSFVTSLDGWKQCYRIKAVEAQNASIESWSNKLCIEFDPRLYIPNAFTPGNGDMLNNWFRIVATNYRSFNVVIYNRWGERIFESDTPEKQWDGKFHDKECTEGVYLYMVQVKGATKNIYKSGTLHLMR